MEGDVGGTYVDGWSGVVVKKGEKAPWTGFIGKKR
jgi:hypothetical protein